MADLSEQLQQQVLDARANKRPLTIVGGHTKAFMGRQTTGQLLNTAEHSGIINYQPVELVLTARAGTTIIEIEQALAANNQMLAFEPPVFSASSTIGGTLACNLSGPARPWGGSIRDHVLGVRIINGLGEHLKFGGQVMKNVAGYDVSRLQAGAMGSLGIITEISLKVMPKPASTATLVWDMPASEAITFINELAGKPKPISAMCWLQGRLYVRLSGARSAVEATIKQWQTQELTDADAFWDSLRHQQHPIFNNGLPLWRFSVNSAASMPSLDSDSLIDWGGSQRWYAGVQDLDEMQALAANAGGHVSLYSGGDRSADVMHRLPMTVQNIQKRIKASFDPDHIINPGRLYSWM